MLQLYCLKTVVVAIDNVSLVSREASGSMSNEVVTISQGMSMWTGSLSAETSGDQLGERRHSMEMIYSKSSED